MSDDAPQTFQAMDRSERDHLVALAHLDGEDPTGMDVQRQVESLRDGERPSNVTTYAALESLETWGFADSVAVHAHKTAYSLTDEGAAFLDAAALNP